MRIHEHSENLGKLLKKLEEFKRNLKS